MLQALTRFIEPRSTTEGSTSVHGPPSVPPTRLNWGLRFFFSEFVRVSLRQPSRAFFFGRAVLWQGRAARIRARHAREGLTVPPIIIFSITNRCNLR